VRVQAALERLPGVESARVDFSTKTAVVEGDGVDAEVVRRRIDSLDTRLTLRHWLHRVLRRM
jgi:copper chaperone CopZ